MNAYDLVYNKHCSKCALRHEDNCQYKNCSKEQYDSWIKEEQRKITDIYFDGEYKG